MTANPGDPAALAEYYNEERTQRESVERQLAELRSTVQTDRAEQDRRKDLLAEALGYKQAPPDPAKLAQDAADANRRADRAQAAARQQEVELAAYRAAAAAGVDADQLLDSRAFLARVGKLDPAASDFTDQLGAAISAASASTVPVRTEQPDTSANGERQPQQWTMDDVADARAKDPALIAVAQEAGLLTDLGYPPRGGAPSSRYDDDPRVTRARRRAELTANFGGEDGTAITRQDVTDADPKIVRVWLDAGKLAHLGGPAPQGRRPR